MPRRHGSRMSLNPLPQQPSGNVCLGGDAPVSRFRLCCPRCWNRLPAKLKVALSVPKGTNPHLVTTAEFLAAKERAADWLAGEREVVR